MKNINIISPIVEGHLIKEQAGFMPGVAAWIIPPLGYTPGYKAGWPKVYPPRPDYTPMAELQTSSFNEIVDALIGKTPQIVLLTSLNLSN